MVKDNTNKHFTDLLLFLKKRYKGIAGGQVYKTTPPSFPYMYFKQIDGSTALGTLSNTEDGINLGYEIKFYSKKSPDDVRKIANSAREHMIGNGFNCAYFSSVENVSDSSVFQFLTRFSKLETD